MPAGPSAPRPPIAPPMAPPPSMPIAGVAALRAELIAAMRFCDAFTLASADFSPAAICEVSTCPTTFSGGSFMWRASLSFASA